MEPTLIVLAAGLGSRYGNFKQIDGFGPNNEIILEYSVYDAIRAGFRRVALVVNQQTEQALRDYLAQRIPEGIEILYIRQQLHDLPEGFTLPVARQKPWGTGHAIYVALRHIKDPVAIVNADDFYGQSAYSQAYQFLSTNTNVAQHCIVAYPLVNTLSDFGTVSRGICTIDSNGYLVDIVEHEKIYRAGEKIISLKNGSEQLFNNGTLCSMNCVCLSQGVSEAFGELFKEFLLSCTNETIVKSEFYLPWVMNQLTRKYGHRVQVNVCNETWFGVTYSEDKENVRAKIQNLIARGVYPLHLWN